MRSLTDIHTYIAIHMTAEGTQHLRESAYISFNPKQSCVLTCMVHFAYAYDVPCKKSKVPLVE